ncbi:MAG: hypothetical protein WC412_04305 [Candidatus Omnitrophota bacterium]|jgi:hypothetical protein
MGVYIYCIKEDYQHSSLIKDRSFENEWFKLENDGTVIVKGTNRKGYSWDGCSPKWKIKDIYFGTPEGVLNFDTGKNKTYFASLIHDVFYQFSPDVRSFIKRKEVDNEFYLILKENNFRGAVVYYFAVRMLGWIYWGKCIKAIRRVKKVFGIS